MLIRYWVPLTPEQKLKGDQDAVLCLAIASALRVVPGWQLMLNKYLLNKCINSSRKTVSQNNL